MNQEILNNFYNTLTQIISNTKKSKNSYNQFNGWIDSEFYKVYIRITSRFINGKIHETIDIGSISVNEEFQKKGIFTAILKACEEKAKECNMTVFVENVLNEIISNKLKRIGYLTVENVENCFYKSFDTARISRPEISSEKFEEAMVLIRKGIDKAINKHGYGGFVSWHEILGKIDEEHVEFINEVRDETDKRLDEIVDIAVAAIWGVASHLDGCIMKD